MKPLPEASHRAHHYPTLIRRWRAAARKWKLKLTQYAEHDGFPLYAVETRRPHPHKTPRGSFYLSTGIHGDEPGGTEGVIAWAEKYGNVFAQAEFIIFPCHNPWGLTNNIRTDASGVDLNRQFHNWNIPAFCALRKLVAGRHFDLAMTLHEDYDGQGIYIYELNAAKTPLSPVLLQAASRVIPTDPRRKIDSRRFPQSGYIHRNVRRRKIPEGPEAITLALEHADLCFTVETPSEFALHRRVESHGIIIQTAINHVLQRKRTRLS